MLQNISVTSTPTQVITTAKPIMRFIHHTAHVLIIKAASKQYVIEWNLVRSQSHITFREYDSNRDQPYNFQF
jgi:hypothetical protein